MSNRSEGSVEFKHQNISAVLIQAGYVYIRGYKPAWNYQELLEMVVLDRISASEALLTDIETSLIDQPGADATVANSDSIIVPPPERLPAKNIRDRADRMPRTIDYAARESQNRVLGEKGESFVLAFERQRLETLGRKDLVGDIEWTSKEKGDGTGYDIRSFQDDTDEPLYIEVKTTNSGKYQPFIISRNELAFSSEFADQFALYRLFEFSRSPAMFVLDGEVSKFVDLAPTMYNASFQRRSSKAE